MSELGHKKLGPLFASLRSAATGEIDLAQILPCLDRLQEELDLVLREHAGMADELLRAYEQLGIVFEVTRSLTSVQTEGEVVRLFIDSLNITYSQELVRRRSGIDESGVESKPAA